MSHEPQQQATAAALALAVCASGGASGGGGADALFSSIAQFLQAVAQGGVQRPELYAPALNLLAERAEQLLRAPLDPIPLPLPLPQPLPASLPATNNAVRTG